MQNAVYTYAKKKRDEMTFGYLKDHVLADLVPDMTGSLSIHSQSEIREKMALMDSGFVGLRRSTIDQLKGEVRQLILYSTIVRVVEGELQVAVYQRAAGAEAKLKDGYSLGFGGHVDAGDLTPYIVGEKFEPVEGTASSYFSTMTSGLREISEEVLFSTPGVNMPMDPQEVVTAILKHLGYENIANEHVTAEQLETYRAQAVASNDKFVIVKDDEHEKRGIIYYAAPQSPDDVYKAVFGKEPATDRVKFIDTELTPYGFLSDINPENPDHIGNTHIAVLAVLPVPASHDFKVAEENYTTIGWMNVEQLKESVDKFEPWSKIIIDNIEVVIPELVREENRRQANINDVRKAAIADFDEVSAADLEQDRDPLTGEPVEQA